MRCSQPYGLTKEAFDFLSKNALVVNQCQHCNRHDGFQTEVIGNYGMFDELELHLYKLQNDLTAKEVVQYESWSSGPMIWLCLHISDGRCFRWDEKEIESVVLQDMATEGEH